MGSTQVKTVSELHHEYESKQRPNIGRDEYIEYGRCSGLPTDDRHCIHVDAGYATVAPPSP